MTEKPESFDESKLAEVRIDVARTIVSDAPIRAILDLLVARIVEILPIDAVGVSLIAASTASHQFSASAPDALGYEKLQAELGEGPCLLAYSSDDDVRIALGSLTQFPDDVVRIDRSLWPGCSGKQ